MSTLWNSFKIAFAMFSKIPMPQAEWNQKNMQYMMCFFPFIGLVTGAAVYAVAFAGNSLHLQQGFLCAILVILPVLITGGIHVDGLLDTADAMSSWQERARRLEILKDSNAGAFAVITACVYFLLQFGAWQQVYTNRKVWLILGLGFMISRCFSGIGVVSIPKARADGTVSEFSRNAQEKKVRMVLVIYLVILAALAIAVSPVLGSAAIVTAILVYVHYYKMAMKYFGGTTGDLSGYFLCICETAMLVVMALIVAFMEAGFIWK